MKKIISSAEVVAIKNKSLSFQIIFIGKKIVKSNEFKPLEKRVVCKWAEINVYASFISRVFILNSNNRRMYRNFITSRPRVSAEQT